MTSPLLRPTSAPAPVPDPVPDPVPALVPAPAPGAVRRAVVALGGALLLGACGSSGAGPREDGIGEPVVPEESAALDLAPVPAGTEELRVAVRTYGDALLTGDAPLAYALLTETCRGQVDARGFEVLVEQAGRAYGEPLPFATFRADLGDGDEEGDVAEVDYRFRGAAELVQTDERWERTGDGWRLADC